MAHNLTRKLKLEVKKLKAKLRKKETELPRFCDGCPRRGLKPWDVDKLIERTEIKVTTLR